MSQKFLSSKLMFLLVSALPVIGFTCDVCRGNPNSSLSEGMDMAILTLLGFTVSVLGGFATFFIHLKKKSPGYRQKTENNTQQNREII